MIKLQKIFTKIKESIETKQSNVMEKKIAKVLNEFKELDSIVVASVACYEQYYQPTHVGEIVGYYDKKNKRVIDIVTGQVYMIVPVRDYKYVVEHDFENNMELGKNYIRNIVPLSSSLMDSYKYSRKYDFTTVSGLRKTLLEPYKTFINVTDNGENLEYFDNIQNQIEYFINNCVYKVGLCEIGMVDKFGNDKTRISKYNRTISNYKPICYNHIVGTKEFYEEIKTGVKYQTESALTNGNIPKQLVISTSKVLPGELDNEMVEMIEKKYFDSCGRLKTKAKQKVNK